MKAMVLKGPNTAFELTHVPDPVAAAGAAVARVIACGSGLTIQHIKAGADEVVDASAGNAAEALLELTGTPKSGQDAAFLRYIKAGLAAKSYSSTRPGYGTTRSDPPPESDPTTIDIYHRSGHGAVKRPEGNPAC